MIELSPGKFGLDKIIRGKIILVVGVLTVRGTMLAGNAVCAFRGVPQGRLEAFLDLGWWETKL